MKIYSFGLGIPSSEISPEILGGKGAGLVWMDLHGIKVPPGFIIPTSVCNAYMKNPQKVMEQVKEEVQPWMQMLTEKFGYTPLVSVRSGARQSMPGMMDTILNVGLDLMTVTAWHGRLGKKCVHDSWRRLIEMYGSVVHGIDRSKFEGLDHVGAGKLFYAETGEVSFPDANGQLIGAIEAVFKSWNNERAKIYRKMNGISEDWGTAVTVQAMVFGNMNDQSGTGVLFTRDCNSGADEVVGEFLINAQGEDVVAGIRTPMKLSEMKNWNAEVSAQLMETVIKLENLKRDVQDVEFTIQNGELFILQTRNAKRTARAAVRIAVDMYSEGLLPTRKEVLSRVSFKDYVKAQVPVIDPKYKTAPDHKGIPACAGIVTGAVVFSAEEATLSKSPVILVTQETTPDDIAGMAAAVGVLTMTGGATSHAAVVARGMNKPAVVGLSAPLSFFKAGSKITIDGSTGNVWMHGEVQVVSGVTDEYISKFNDLLTQEPSFLGVVDCQNGDVIDADGMTIKQMREAVGKALETREKVIVDLRSDKGYANTVFSAMFGMDSKPEFDFENALVIEQLFGKKVWFISDHKLPEPLQSIATVSSPEELVMAQGDFVFTGPVDAPWAKKLLAMKQKIENAGPVAFGYMDDQVKGYMSMVQLAKMLLK